MNLQSSQLQTLVGGQTLDGLHLGDQVGVLHLELLRVAGILLALALYQNALDHVEEVEANGALLRSLARSVICFCKKCSTIILYNFIAFDNNLRGLCRCCCLC